MKGCVVGYGSIGIRHARILEHLGCDVAVVSRRPNVHPKSFANISEALKQHPSDYVVIASRTSEHLKDLTTLADSGFEGSVLVEKPLMANRAEIPDNKFKRQFVGYNMRFNPVVSKLKFYLEDVSVMAIQIYVGQYLPDWRAETDYRKSYSAKKSESGGALRDLSHELDYLLWMLGPWKRLTAGGGHFSDLDIDTEDVVGVLAELERCPVATLHLNYLDSRLRREVIALTSNGTIKADLVSGMIEVEGRTECYESVRDETYIAEHKAALGLTTKDASTFEEGMAVVAMIDAVENAMASGMWINNE